MTWWDDPDVAKIASSVARRYAGYVESQDIRQELVLWCLEDEPRATLLWEAPWWFKNRRLWTLAQRYARTEKAAAVGHDIDDEFFYSPAVLKHILPDAFDGESTPPQSAFDEVKVRSGNGHGLEWETMIADVRNALGSISDSDFELLWAVYGERGSTLTAYATTKGWDYRRAARAERKALGRLLSLLGGATPWTDDLTSTSPEEAHKGTLEARGAANMREPIHV